MRVLIQKTVDASSKKVLAFLLSLGALLIAQLFVSTVALGQAAPNSAATNLIQKAAEKAIAAKNAAQAKKVTAEAKNPSATSTFKAPDAKLTDQNIVKAFDLEQLLLKKVNHLIEPYISDASLYKASVSVLLSRYEVPEATAKQNETTPKRPLAPVAEGSIFDVQRMVDYYSDEIKDLKNQGRPIEISMKNTVGTIDDKAYYEVSKLKLLVSVDPTVKQEVFQKIEADLKSTFEPIFSERLALSVQANTVKPTFTERAFVAAQKLQPALIAALCALALLTALILNKKVPSWQAFKPLLTEQTHNSQTVNQNIAKTENESVGENPEDIDVNQEPPVGVTPNMSAEEKALYKQVEEIESQLAIFVNANAPIARALLQEWIGVDGGLDRVAITIETLARHKVNIEKVEVRGDILKKIREFKSGSSEITLNDRRRLLQEVYWAMVSGAFVGEELAVSPFLFLEGVSDSALKEILAKEDMIAQAAVMTGIDEKRAARVISSMDPEMRQGIFSQMCSGQVLAPDETRQLLERLQGSVQEYLQAHDRRLEASNTGVAALAPILSKMDFAVEFTTASGLMNIDKDLRRSLEQSYFNVALLPDARADFLSGLFADKDSDWIEAILSLFTPEFRQRVISILPPMQQEMLNEGGLAVNKTKALNLAQELNTSILDRLRKKEVGYPDIFSDTANEDTVTLAPTDGGFGNEQMAA